MELVTLGLFCAILILCLTLGASTLLALVMGLLLFLGYGLLTGHSLVGLLKASLDGIKAVRNILITFALLGLLTALWRACGTIPLIVCYASRLIRPSIFLLMVFLLNCGVSLLTGTSFGTAATMGVISATMASTMGVSPLLSGGAVLSGIYFGDRCSPVSTSALLVGEVTGTSIFSNIPLMLRTGWVPFGITCAVYTLAGLAGSTGSAMLDIYALFSRAFRLHWFALIPAAVILLLSFFRVNVKATLLVSIAFALICALAVEQIPLTTLPDLFLYGYRSSDPELAAMLNGGGLLSMVNVSAIVCVSSCYAGIFELTGLLKPVQQLLSRTARVITPCGTIILTSIVTAMIACNQSLSTMLTAQLCSDLKSGQELAIDMENSVVVIAPLIPWCIAGAVPIAAIGAPTLCLLAACYLYLLPAWMFISQFLHKK